MKLFYIAYDCKYTDVLVPDQMKPVKILNTHHMGTVFNNTVINYFSPVLSRFSSIHT